MHCHSARQYDSGSGDFAQGFANSGGFDFGMLGVARLGPGFQWPNCNVEQNSIQLPLVIQDSYFPLNNGDFSIVM